MKKDKSAHTTCLCGDTMVPKNHPRIVFRGRLDTLQAEFIEAQVLAWENGDDELVGCLGEVLEYLRSMMAAEVMEKSLLPPALFEMDPEELHQRSHNAGDKNFAFPCHEQGPLAVRLNTLRARVREVELAAIDAFDQRDDIILGLNRLSSALWWLYSEYVAKSG